MDDEVLILSAGLVTPAGLSLPECAAAVRARVAALRETVWHDRRVQPIIAGTVPDEALPPRASALAAQPFTRRVDRLLRLAHAALEDLQDSTPPQDPATAPRPLPLLLALPEHLTLTPLDTAAFLAALDRQCPGRIDLARSLAVAQGRAAGLMALREARARLRRGEAEEVLVGGVDCLVDPVVLARLDDAGRIRGEVVSDGLSPSEGAAFLRLGRRAAADQAPLARLLGTGLGQEPGHLHAQAPYLGEGLAQAFAALLGEAPPPSPIGCVYASFNGERYWAREYGVARLRQAPAFDESHQMEHPAECFGDLGAAHGPALAALAAHGLRHGYRRSPCLVFASSDHGQRAASLLARAD